ncbi:MAG: YajQ family cyclic di-GMP-binding protein [Leptospirales bacterium]|nr:YajQ family cyclic di-GMP-binding protein [Leptospirales bacterium]
MSEHSFDVACKVDRQELSNALDMANKEIATRFDFKGALARIDLQKDAIQLEAQDEVKMRQLIDVVQSKLAKRDLNLKAFKFGEFQSNVSGIAKCKVDIQNGLTQDQTKVINRIIKDSKLKVQSRIQGDAVRVTGKNKDDLQQIQKAIRDADLEFACVFDNYR